MATINRLVANNLQNIFFCVQNTTWVNDDRNFIFAWTIPLDQMKPPEYSVNTLMYENQLFYSSISSVCFCKPFEST